jgi:hypothetical protein
MFFIRQRGIKADQQFSQAIYPGIGNFNNPTTGFIFPVVLFLDSLLSPDFEVKNESP